MKSLAIFNNKGGVGKTTLTFHLGAALAEMGHRTLLVDLDPQCNLTLHAMTPEALERLWDEEEPFIEDWESTVDATPTDSTIFTQPRSVHFHLKAVEDGQTEAPVQPPPLPLRQVSENLWLLPGRLTLHLFEQALTARWSDTFRGDALALRTASRIRLLCAELARQVQADIVLIDTSPSLGHLNRLILSGADAFLMPCFPDMFSLYGIKNIGKAIQAWTTEFEALFRALPPNKSRHISRSFRFLGYTIVNARKYSTSKNPYGLAAAHYAYVKRIPAAIQQYIPASALTNAGTIDQPVGHTAVMYSYNTYPSTAQRYCVPIWRLPTVPLSAEDRGTIQLNRGAFFAVRDDYHAFAGEVLQRLRTL